MNRYNFCLSSLKVALELDILKIFNLDQGSQFASNDFTKELRRREIAIRMDGKRRAFDNIFVERLWQSVKYEDIYIKDYFNMIEAYQGLSSYFKFYNNERPHQSLGYRTPAEVYYDKTLTGTND